jgi:adenine-specific DNA-methyltransferase
MATTDTKQQLKDLFRELFQLNNTDLDFGIYRIMNIKSKEVENFITKDLDEKVESVKSKILDRQSGDIKAELEDAKAKLEKDFQVNFQQDGDIEAKANQYGQLPLFLEPFKKFKTAKDKLDNLRVSEDTEKSIYNELYRFFERYYEGGDFISKPRAGKNNYMIPYEGEEVKLYWANYDQYYIKTGDNFKNYLFNNQSADPKTFTQIEFRILDADTAMNNNKEEKGRLFIPIEEPFEWIEEERKLLVKFNYRVPTPEEKKIWGDKQSVKTDSKGINQKLAAMVNDAAKKIKDTELLVLLGKTKANSKGEAIALFQYHLERYTTVNKFDYFIHKNLKEFLHRELDNFLKSDVLSIAFLDADWKEQEVQEAIKNNVLKASAIRDIALVVIEFISELEEFQKRLFEKKKFVVESNYCMTLDRIPVSVYEEVIEYILTDKDKKQIADWIDLKFISGTELEAENLKAKGKKKEEPTFESAKVYLTANNKLVLDTKYLPDNLKWKLLASIENLDESTDGLLINSENWQALNFIQAKYKTQIRSVYIDPPFNTGDGDFLYKDSMQHSSWMCMMVDRLKMSKNLMSKNAGIYAHIDYKEVANLKQLQEKVFGTENFVQLISVKAASPAGFKTVNPGPIDVTEYILFSVKSRNDFEFKKSFTPVEYDTNYGLVIENVVKKCSEWVFLSIIDSVYKENGIANNKEAKEKWGDYWKIIRDNLIAVYALENKNRIVSIRDPQKPTDDLKALLKKSKDDDAVYEYKKENGESSYAYKGGLLSFYSNKVRTIDGVETPTELLTDFWNDISWAGIANEGNVKLKNGKKPERLLKRIIESIAANRSDYTLDFFSGSGTTPSVSHKLGIKWIGIEMGRYFDELTKRRLVNVLNGEQTGISKLQSPNWTGGGIFQYIKLEQYEDSINNIEIHTTAPQLSFIDNIRYQLLHGTKNSDSLINLEKFTKPFSYTMKIVQQNEPKEDTVIDLVTTFNFLLGIEVQRYVLAENNGLEYRVVFGKKGLQQYIIIWRNFDETTIDLKAEKEFITKQDWFSKTSLVFCNGDNAFSAHPIEPEFIRLMNEPVL